MCRMPETAVLFGYNQNMTIRWLMICAAILALATPALAQSTPVDTLHGHFAAISAEDYPAADLYFSSAFRKAFKNEQRAEVDSYYLARKAQLDRGYEILEVMELADGDRETVRITVDFGDPVPDAPIGITERMYYYLIRQKVDPDAPLADGDNRAWRIDIFDALSYDTLADARRRPYLYTNESWDDEGSRELRSRQGIFRIQYALNRYYEDHGQFPFRLRGRDNRRDELISGGYIYERYPENGFNGQPMEAVEFGKKSSGDFAYYSVDADGDGQREGYWLLLHGKSRDAAYFEHHDAIYILGSTAGTQAELAGAFSQYWVDRGSEYLVLSPYLLLSEPLETGSLIDPLHPTVAPGGELPEVPTAPAESADLKPISPADGSPAPVVTDTPVDQPGIAVEDILVEGELPNAIDILTQALAFETVAAVREVADSLAGSEQPGEAPLELKPVKPEKLKVYHYGF